MDSATETVQKQIRQILNQQTLVPRPTHTICATIAGLKDLCELQGMSIRSEWRRGNGTPGGAEPGSPYRFHSSSSSDSLNRKMGFRGGNSTPGAPAAETPMSRVSSRQSVDQGASPTSNTPPPPVAKYVSKFKNSNQPVEDKILNNIILSKLNKFSHTTYTEIREFLYQVLGSGEPDLQDMIRHFMRLVFRKAAIEEIFCPLYAKLLCEISARYSVILQEMHTLQNNYLAIFDAVEESKDADYETFVESQKDKQYRRGYSQFLAELAALEIMDFDLLNKSFQRILANMIVLGKEEDKKTLLEEYSDCLFRMAKVLKRKQTQFFVRARSTLWKSNEKDLMDLVENYESYKSESAKTRFMLMDVIDILKGS